MSLSLILMTLCRQLRHAQKIRITYVSNSFSLSVIYDVSFWFENRKVVIRLSLLRSDRAVAAWPVGHDVSGVCESFCTVELSVGKQVEAS